MINDVMKLTWPGGTLLFDDQTAMRLEIEKNQAYDIQILQNRRPIIYLTGTMWKKYTLYLFNPDDSSYIQSAETLRGITDYINLFWDYKDRPKESVIVRVDPNIKIPMIEGKFNAVEPIIITFYETIGDQATFTFDFMPLGRF